MKYLTFFFLTLCLFLSCTANNSHNTVPTSASDVSPLLIGSSVPDIALIDPDNKSVNLSEIGSKKALFVFYRGGWCPFCSKELSELVKIEEKLYERGITVVGISPDRPEFLRESLNEIKTEYTLLSDSNMDAARAFGIAFRVDRQTIQSLKENGMDIELRSGQNHHMLPVTSVFLTNSDGFIEFQYVNPDYRTRVSPSVLLAAIDAMLES